MTKLWVDYTNWKGRRAWREIGPIEAPKWELYVDEGWTWTLHVWMMDKGGARRTLRLDHIHGFHIGSEPPPQEPSP